MRWAFSRCGRIVHVNRTRRAGRKGKEDTGQRGRWMERRPQEGVMRASRAEVEGSAPDQEEERMGPYRQVCLWQGRKLREFSIDGLNFLGEGRGKVICRAERGRW